MKKIALICVLLLLLVFIKAQTVDITIHSQYRAQNDTTGNSEVHDSDDIELTENEFIQETYQIPGYSLYDQYWDTENICSRPLNIPFGGNSLRIILVQSNNNPFFFPCALNSSVTTRYGMIKNEFHPGVDLAVKSGSPVKNCFDGVVRMAKIYGDYGRVVVVRHYNGLETVYANLSKIWVKPGQILQAGDIIGATGKSKRTGAEQLHFETRFMNACFDPSMIIDFDYMELKDNTLVLNETDLEIPEKSKEVVSPKQESITKEANVQKSEKTVAPQEKQEQKENQAEYHIVKAGETMYRISVQYKVPLTKLLELNNMKETDVIDIGQKIRVK